MANRREFIQVAALAAAPLSAVGGLMAPLSVGAAEQAAPLYAVVYDRRFADSEAFGRQARRQGLRTRAISGDITDLWYHDLYHRWKKGPAAIAGLTTTDALFCLETFGNDVGLRLVMRAEHRVRGGRVDHTLSGPQAFLQTASLDQCGGAWSARMAQMVGRCPATRADRIDAAAVSHLDSSGVQDQPVLVSWVLAPLKRA